LQSVLVLTAALHVFLEILRDTSNLLKLIKLQYDALKVIKTTSLSK